MKKQKLLFVLLLTQPMWLWIGRAQAQVSLSSASAALAPGATVEMDVSVDVGSSPLGGYLYNVSYDPRFLSVSSIAATGILNQFFVSNALSTGPAPVLGLNPASLTSPFGNVSLAKVIFKVSTDTSVFAGSFVIVTTVTVSPVDSVGTVGQALPVTGAQVLYQLRLPLRDQTPPVTAMIVRPSFTDSSGRLFASTGALVGFSAVDIPSAGVPASGVDRTEFRVDVPTGPFVVFTSSFALTEGVHQIDFRSVDKAGNVEVFKSSSVRIDGTAPITQLVVSSPAFQLAAGLLIGPTTPLSLSAADPVSNGVASGVKDTFVAVDTTIFSLASGTFTMTGPDGPHTISFFSRDNVLNTEAVKSASIVLDATPPAASLLSPSSRALGMDQIFGKGQIPVIATVSDLHLASWTLSVASGSNAQTGFSTLAASTLPVFASTIAVWNTAGLSGFFTLELTAVDAVANATVTTATVFIGDPTLLLTLKNSKQGEGRLKQPSGAAVDVSGNIYVANTGRNEVLKFDAKGALLASFDGSTRFRTRRREENDKGNDDGKAETVRFSKPTGLAIDAAFNLYVADRNNDRIAVLNSSGTVIRSLGRTNPEGRFIPGSGPGEFNHPTGVAVSTDHVVVADRNNGRVQVFDLGGRFLFQVPLNLSGLPFGVAVDSSDDFYATDEENNRLLAFDPQGNPLFIVGSSGAALGQFLEPRGVAASVLKYLYAADSGNHRVQKFDPFQDPVLAFGPVFALGNVARGQLSPKDVVGGEDSCPERCFRGALSRPTGLALDVGTNLYVTDRENNLVLKFGLPGGTTSVVLVPGGRSARKTMDAAGGKIERDDRVSVAIPPGALIAPLEIAIDPESPGTQPEETRKLSALAEKKLLPISDGVQYGPEGTVFNQPVTLTLAYDPSVLPPGIEERDLKIYYWNPAALAWEEMPSLVDASSATVSAQTGHFSLYKILGPSLPASAAAFQWGNVYVYPNPARGGAKPTFHIEVGIAETVGIKVYSVSGRLVMETELSGAPQIIDDGTGPKLAYEYVWDGHIASGVYLYVLTAKSGGNKLTKTGKCAVVR